MGFVRVTSLSTLFKAFTTPFSSSSFSFNPFLITFYLVLSSTHFPGESADAYRLKRWLFCSPILFFWFSLFQKMILTFLFAFAKALGGGNTTTRRTSEGPSNIQRWITIGAIVIFGMTLRNRLGVWTGKPSPVRFM